MTVTIGIFIYLLFENLPLIVVSLYSAISQTSLLLTILGAFILS